MTDKEPRWYPLWNLVVLGLIWAGLTLFLIWPSLGCASLSPPLIITVVVTPTLAPVPTNAPEAASSPITVDGVTMLTDTVRLTVTIRSAEPTAYLFDTPVLRGAAEVTPLPASLEAAHFALLDTITAGQATAALEFPKPGGDPPWTLVLNPLHEPESYVAPRVEVEVEP
jgi:hypothetical protein